MKKNVTHNEKGYVLVGVLFILTLSLIIAAGMLNSSATNAKTRALVTTQADYYYEAEETLNRVTAWLQSNSKNIVNAFSSANFNNNFDRGAPALGDNEGEFFGVPTMVKMKGSAHSVMLSNNPFFGQAAFPATTNIDSGAPFDAMAAFQSADLGRANARLILIWARQTDGAYEPIFRADVITGNNPDRGVHSYSYVYSTLVNLTGGVGFYGKTHLFLETPNNDCYSYQYTYNAGAWSRGAPRSNCPVASDAEINISSKVYGTAKTLLEDGIVLSPPGGSVSGEKCMGAGCHNYHLPALGNWDSYCPGNTTDVTISSDTTWPAGGCWRNVTINHKKTLNLTDTHNPYYIKYINFGGDQAHLDFGSLPQDQQVTLFVEQLNNNYHFNGNNMLNTHNAPHQVWINYLGSEKLYLDGTAAINAVIIAPYAIVDVRGNFNFYGGIQALTLDVGGHARINYDEALGYMPVLSDITYDLKKTSQRYR